MTDQHPITPPPELVEQWRNLPEYVSQLRTMSMLTITTEKLQDIATQAARWGADHELEACCEWLSFYAASSEARDLRTARRPKPQSLKEQALEEIQEIEGAMYSAGLGCDFTATRRALETLPND